MSKAHGREDVVVIKLTDNDDGDHDDKVKDNDDDKAKYMYDRPHGCFFCCASRPLAPRRFFLG